MPRPPKDITSFYLCFHPNGGGYTITPLYKPEKQILRIKTLAKATQLVKGKGEVCTVRLTIPIYPHCYGGRGRVFRGFSYWRDLGWENRMGRKDKA